MGGNPLHYLSIDSQLKQTVYDAVLERAVEMDDKQREAMIKRLEVVIRNSIVKAFGA